MDLYDQIQQRWIRKNGTEEDFIRRYGKSWLSMEM